MNQAQIKDWFICTATGFMLFLLGLLFPILALPATLLYSFPTAFLAFERGIAPAVLSAVTTMFVLACVVPGIYGVMYFVMFGFSGILIGRFANYVKARENLLVASASAEFIGKLAAIVIFFRVTGMNLLSPDTAEIEKFMLSLGGYPDETVRDVINQIVLLIPYSMIIFSTVEALLCLVLVSYIHKKRTGAAIFSLPVFGEWAFPKSVLAALVVGFICIQASNGRPDLYMVRQIGANLSEISRTIFIIQGLSCIYCFMERRGIPKFLRIVVIIFTPFISFLGNICAIAGVADMGFNLRKKFRGA